MSAIEAIAGALAAAKSLTPRPRAVKGSILTLSSIFGAINERAI
jgi:hypothetical protein